MNVPSCKLELLLLMEVSLLTFSSNITQISRESKSRNARGKVAAEMALKLKKSDLNVFMSIRNC